MNWFLVLLFWNPAIQDFDVADGWAPIPMTTYQQCDLKLQYVEQYLPSATEGIEFVVGCIQTTSQQEAIAILKGN
jgi:hypothetical protein